MKTLLLALITLFPALSMAADPLPLTRSAGALAREGVTEEQLLAAPAVSGQVQPLSTRQAARSGCGCFEIYDVWIRQSVDEDGDGYHQRLSVEFDADTTNAHETVYAKLYLRRDNGPWVLYSETDLYDIHYDDSIDSYEVSTQLLEGFPPGRYELMIDLYALYYDGIVASRIIRFDDAGQPLYLEDEQHDQPSVEVIVITPDPQPDGVVVIEDSSVYAGSFSPAWLLALALLAGLRRKKAGMTGGQ